MTRQSPVSLLAAMFFLLIACAKTDGVQASPGKNSAMMNTQIMALPAEPLSAYEQASLLHMREEEKLARDVYQALYAKWGLQQFSNIAASEQRHMDAVLNLLNKYNLTDPAANKQPGEFADAGLQQLYNKLMADGMQSASAALTVGATIEDLDLFDLAEAIEKSDNQDIDMVYGNLAKGSRNHMRAFNRGLQSSGITYVPQYISQTVFDSIINSAQERGMQ
ncbi:MAG: DUF2202 domain-containing protein [Chitinophagaceae bacterium]|nr:DUF2202 domain-containing protein [Chitinophagaceae bacterium]